MISCTDEQLKFSVYIINQISQVVKKPTSVIFALLAESGVLDDYIIGCYDSLHTSGREYLVEDITGLLYDRGITL